jgi:two-component system phosphate regulon sensor histidine kinase PhoR
MGRIFFKLTAGVVCLLLMALIAVDFAATSIARENYISNLTRQLSDKCAMLAFHAPPDGVWDPARTRELARAADARVTVIDRAGRVLADSEARPAGMENHRSRPEVQRALRGQIGSNVRLSATIGVDFLYVAAPFDGGVIRLAVPLADINRQVAAMRRRILAGTALAFLPAILVAALLARWLSQRFAAILAHASELAKGNFRARLPQTGGSEFGQLGQKLNETAEKLGNAVEQLQREHAELERVERVRKDFVTNVSNELRTPLASIQGYTETLIDGAVDDPQHNQRFLGIIRHNAERLARLTADLLTLSRVEQRR